MKDKKILIIGGAGFLGQTIMKPLLKEEVPFFYADLKHINYNIISRSYLLNKRKKKFDSFKWKTHAHERGLEARQ